MKLLQDQTPVESKAVFIYNERIIELFTPEKNPELLKTITNILTELKSEISKHNKFASNEFNFDSENIIQFKIETQSY